MFGPFVTDSKESIMVKQNIIILDEKENERLELVYGEENYASS